MSHVTTRSLHSPWRWAVIALLLGNAVIHLLLTPMHLEEARYIGLGFIALSLACIALAGALALAGTPAAWAATGAVNVLGLAAFIASRTIGLPLIEDDIGNWGEPLGLLTMLVETLAIGLSLTALRERTPGALGVIPVRQATLTHTNKS